MENRYDHSFGPRSRAALATCHPALQALATRALELSPIDFTVTEGFRGRDAQEQAYATGHSKAHFGQSPHNHEPSLALDVVPYPVDWSDPKKFRTIADAFKQAAKEQDVTLRWGGDFKKFVDMPHFEIDEPQAGRGASSSPAPAAGAAPRPLSSRDDLAGLPEVELLARVIWGECRGTDADEARAIAHVVVNRAARPGWWGTTVKECCLKAKQFSCLNPGDPNLPKILTGNFRDGAWATCILEAADALLGASQDPTGGAISYHAANMSTYPSWAKELTKTARIGSHIFYREA